MKGSLSQASLFEPVAHARHGDPSTSHEAAASVRGLTATQEKVRACLISGPKTDEQIIAAFRDYFPDDTTTDQSIRSRRSELVNPRFPKQPMVRWTGEYGLTSHNGKTRVWELIPATRWAGTLSGTHTNADERSARRSNAVQPAHLPPSGSAHSEAS